MKNILGLFRFVEYKPTSLEKNYKHEMLTEVDLGVNIDLIDPDTYALDPNSKTQTVLVFNVFICTCMYVHLSIGDLVSKETVFYVGGKVKH